MEPNRTTPTINPEAWQDFIQLWADEPTAVVTELIDEYLRDTEARLGAIRSGLTHGDAGEIERAAHTLKSSSANLGAQRLEEECRIFQELARAEELEALAGRLDRIMGIYEATRTAMEEERDRLRREAGQESE